MAKILEEKTINITKTRRIFEFTVKIPPAPDPARVIVIFGEVLTDDQGNTIDINKNVRELNISQEQLMAALPSKDFALQSFPELYSGLSSLFHSFYS